MSKLPSMPLFVDAYLADTTHLTLEEHGAYLLLLMAMWRREGSVPDDDTMTARMLGLSPRAWLRLKPRLMPLLCIYGPEGAKSLTQKRLQVEWNKSIENSLRQSEKGKAGAKAKWQQKQLLADGRGNGTRYGRSSAPISNRDISSTSLQDAAREEASNGAAPPAGQDKASEASGVAHLLDTPLMRRTA